jgi:hypothetical protein
MKKSYWWILLIGLNAVAILSAGQVRPTPAEVTNTFSKMFPDARNIQWRDKITIFSAFFNIKDVKCEAKFTPTGSWVSTEKAIQLDSLPPLITDSLKSGKYAGWTQTSAYILRSSDGTTQYHVVVTNSDAGRKILFFNQNDRLLSAP